MLRPARPAARPTAGLTVGPTTRRVGFAVAALVLSVVLGGCAAKPRSPNGGPDASDPAGHLAAVRASFKTAYPNALVGPVTAVLDGKPFAMVGELSPPPREGEVVAFLDENDKVVANGKVVKSDETGTAVMFEESGRRPQVGDVAVKF